jgi:hypothetical protein
MPVSLDHALRVMAVLFAAEAASASGHEQPVGAPTQVQAEEHEREP